MGCVRHSKAPLQIRLRASFGTAVLATLLLIVAWLWQPSSTSVDRKVSGRRAQDGIYPPDLILSEPYSEDPNRWLIILHCVGIGYMLLGLNTVCDVYFTGALEVMVEEWNIKPDVAGATFMAAGGSAPEFFTSLIGTTWVISDVGFSTIVGSAVFNVLFVIGLCGYMAPGALKLTWWPLFRDCTFYLIALSCLAVCAADERIGLGEACGLFVGYLVYCAIMYYNPRIEMMVDTKLRKTMTQITPVDETSGESSTVTEPAKGLNKPSEGESSTATQPAKGWTKPSEDSREELQERVSFDGEVTTIAMDADSGSITMVPNDCSTLDGFTNEKESTPNAETEGGEESEEEDEDFMQKPEGGLSLLIWYVSLPVYVPLYLLTPQPRAEKRIFVATFLLSLLWIAGFSSVLIWLSNTLALVLNIPLVIKDFTVLAMGTSIPDAASSVAVTRRGEGDMAVSSSIGSNIFDILFGLPVPWIIKILIEGGSYQVRIFSPFLVFYVVLLLGMVFSVILSIHFLGWKLNTALGAAMALLYMIFLAIAVTVEITEPEGLMI